MRASPGKHLPYAIPKTLTATHKPWRCGALNKAASTSSPAFAYCLKDLACRSCSRPLPTAGSAIKEPAGTKKHTRNAPETATSRLPLDTANIDMIVANALNVLLLLLVAHARCGGHCC